MRQRVRAGRVAHLATVGASGLPHVVPVCFALVGEVAYSAVDKKPKSGRPLRRVANVAETGRATLIVDHYAEDWSTLWWIRLDCRARIIEDPAEAAAAIDALTSKYEQYAESAPPGPVIALEVQRWSGWSAR